MKKKIMHNYLSGSVKKYQFCIIKKQDFSSKKQLWRHPEVNSNANSMAKHRSNKY